jgi:hypothetical protein
VFEVGGQEFRVNYLPAESDSGMFGGNSNWRGPIWFPVNLLIIRALLLYYLYYGDEFTIECPTGSGNELTLFEVAKELSDRLTSIFTRDADGRRPVYGGTARFQESRSIEPGSEVVTLDAPFGRLGLSICYDLRFPEMYRKMGVVDLILVPSSFTATTGKAHWEMLLRARAVENQAYVLAPAQGGHHKNGRDTHGHSMIIDPWGNVLAVLVSGPGVITAEIDHAEIARVRQSLPALTHRVM